MSTVVSPVTHTAETLVNADVSNGGRACCVVDMGDDRSAVPITTAMRNATGTIRAGCAAPFEIRLTIAPCGPSASSSQGHEGP